MSKSAIISLPGEAGVLLIGGWNKNRGEVSDLILEFNIQSNKWETRDEKLYLGRQYPIVLPAPLTSTSCSKRNCNINTYINNFDLHH